MATPEERIAAGQELRKRGKLSSQQDAALKELERRYGLSAAPAVGQRGSMVEKGAISREEYMAQRGGAGFGGRPVPKDVGTYAGGPMATYADEGLLGKKPVASEAMIRDVGATRLALETPQDMNVNKMSRAQSVALGVSDLNPVRLATGDRGYEAAMTESLRDNPVSTRLGQAAAFTAGGGAQLGVKALTVAPKLVAPAVAARFAGQNLGAQAARYTGRGALLAGTGAADYYAYNALAEAPNQFREQGLGTPTVGDRIDYANSQVFTPGGAIAASLGPLASIVYRPVRAAVAGGKNLVTTGTARPAVTAGRPTLPAAAGQSAKAPLTNLFTPSNVQRNVAAITPTTPSKRGRTAREEAIDLLLAKGLKADETEKLVRQISYDNYTNVDEMLFELANADVDQLAVAAARVGGEAKKTFREAFKTRAAEMPERIRTQLRDAMALSGDDLETFAAQMTARADDATADGYKAAYAQQVSDDTWAKIWDRFRASPDAAAAAAAGSRLAKNSYRGNPAQLEAARQLDELADALRSPLYTPPKLSTHALDYLDRGFGSLIAGEKKNNPAFAASLIEIQKAIRSAGLDADTGLDVPRGVYSQYKAASRGIDFGAKAFGRGTPLRDIKKQFSASLKDADEVFEDIVGEGRSVVDQALVMGWLRGAEDAIETATNPGALIRQIYGSERQRAKLMEMMPQETDVMTSGVKGDQTKRIKALVGSALGAEDYKFGFTLGSGVRAEGRAAVPSLFERQRTMLENQGRVSGNSVTGEVTEAIANQGGLQRAADLTARALMNPQDAARNAMLWAVQKVTTPAIFKPEVNRELGRILTTRGRDELLAVVAELRARQAATARRPLTPPAGGAPPVPPAGGSASGRTVGKGKLGTRTADAAAIAMLATGGPTAEADTGGTTETDTGTDAQARIAELSQSQAGAQQQVTEYEQGLKDFKALSVTEKQRFLKENGFLGSDGKPLVIDGRPEGNTAFAIKAYEAQTGEAIAAAKTERDGFKKDINDIRVALAQKPEKQTNPLIDKLTEYGTYGAVAYLAHRGRGAMVKGSQVSANRAAAKANALLTRLPVPPEAPRKTLLSRVPIVGDKQKARIKRETTAANKAQFATEERLSGRDIPPISSNPTSPDGLPNRLANVDEFDRQAAAGDFGPVSRIGRFMEPVNSRFRGADLAVIGTGAADTYITEGMIQKTREDIVAEEKKLTKAIADDKPDAIGLSTKRLEQLRQAETVQVILQRIGIGMMIGGGFGLTHGRYARPQPRYEAAARERDLINRAMAPPPSAPPPAPPAPLPAPAVNTPAPAPAKPRTVGKPKPKPLTAEELRKLEAILKAVRDNKD
jgi:hypothetical protein